MYSLFTPSRQPLAASPLAAAEAALFLPKDPFRLFRRRPSERGLLAFDVVVAVVFPSFSSPELLPSFQQLKKNPQTNVVKKRSVRFDEFSRPKTPVNLELSTLSCVVSNPVYQESISDSLENQSRLELNNFEQQVSFVSIKMTTYGRPICKTGPPRGRNSKKLAEKKRKDKQ